MATAPGATYCGHHLAAVIGDLRQLLLILGVEDFCVKTAADLALSGISGENLLSLIVALTERIWINADGVADMLPPTSQTDGYRITQALARLIQLLPEKCFTDTEHKSQPKEAVTTLRDRFLA